MGGGCFNTTSNNYSSILGGILNDSSGLYSVISGGCLNYASSQGSAILGGQRNCTCSFNDAMIVGSCICAVAACTLHANCLWLGNLPTSAAGLPAGAVWNNSGVLNIV
jgi:hypothetical protein